MLLSVPPASNLPFDLSTAQRGNLIAVHFFFPLWGKTFSQQSVDSWKNRSPSCLTATMQVDDVAECRPTDMHRCRLGCLTAPRRTHISRSAADIWHDCAVSNSRLCRCELLWYADGCKTFYQVWLQDGDISLPQHQSGFSTAGNVDCLYSHSRQPPASN